MLEHSRFSQREWDLAPVYEGPGRNGNVIALDFPVLSGMAQEEEKKGAFRFGGNGDLAMAPVYLGHVPGAFYRVETYDRDLLRIYSAADRETLVVVEGVLKVIKDDDYRRYRVDADDGMFFAGQVTRIAGQKVHIAAVGAFNPATCLAVALFGDADIRIGNRNTPKLG